MDGEGRGELGAALKLEIDGGDAVAAVVYDCSGGVGGAVACEEVNEVDRAGCRQPGEAGDDEDLDQTSAVFHISYRLSSASPDSRLLKMRLTKLKSSMGLKGLVR